MTDYRSRIARAIANHAHRHAGETPPEPKPKRKQRAPERSVRQAILHHFRNDPRIVLWPSPSGMFEQHGQPYMVGTPGQGDLTGLLQGGRFVAIECKSATGQLRDSQKHFRDMIERRGGVYLLVRSVDDVEKFLGTARIGTDCPGAERHG